MALNTIGSNSLDNATLNSGQKIAAAVQDPQKTDGIAEQLATQMKAPEMQALMASMAGAGVEGKQAPRQPGTASVGNAQTNPNAISNLYAQGQPQQQAGSSLGALLAGR